MTTPAGKTSDAAQTDASRNQLAELVRVGKVLSSGLQFPELFTEIMTILRRAVRAEGGTLYIYDNKSESLKAVVLINEPLSFESVVPEFDPLVAKGFIELPVSRGRAGAVAVRSFLERRIIVVDDVESESRDDDLDFSNVRKFDRENNYRTRAMAVFPLVSQDDKPIGVLQLINPDPEVAARRMEFLSLLAAQIGIALNNALLVSEAQNLLASLVRMVVVAIDEKSPHTAGHCQRVTELTMMFAEAVEKEDQGPCADFSMTDEERRELRLAALLHDVGKIITPSHILDKPTKLFTIYDRVGLLRERVRAWKLARDHAALKERVRAAGMEKLIAEAGEEDEESRRWQDDIDFLNGVNRNTVMMNEDAARRLEEIAARRIPPLDGEGAGEGEGESGGGGESEILGGRVMEAEEKRNLEIRRGTLNPEERKVMEEHVAISIRLLQSIPWPRNLRRLVEYAGSHHENMNGTGYPNKLRGEQMSVQARILGIADRFEGISAPDRPYRAVKMTLSRVMRIMHAMRDDNHIDADLFEVFLRRKVYMDYARRHLPPELIDCD